VKIPNHLPWSRRGHLLSSQGGPRNLALLSLLVRLPVRVLFPSNRHPHLVSLQLSPVEEALPQLPRLVGPTHLCGTEEGSYLSPIDSCITQLKAQGPSRTCNESKEEEKKTCANGRQLSSYQLSVCVDGFGLEG